MRRHRKAVLIVLGAVVVVFVAIQFVPYRVTNPPSDGSMPPSYSTSLGMHGTAELSAAQRRALAAGFTKTFGGG